MVDADVDTDEISEEDSDDNEMQPASNDDKKQATPARSGRYKDRVDKSGWSPLQSRVYDKAMRVLNTERLSRLALQGTRLQPFKRRALLDRWMNHMCFFSMNEKKLLMFHLYLVHFLKF